jgi:hypothetical protein
MRRAPCISAVPLLLTVLFASGCAPTGKTTGTTVDTKLGAEPAQRAPCKRSSADTARSPNEVWVAFRQCVQMGDKDGALTFVSTGSRVSIGGAFAEFGDDLPSMGKWWPETIRHGEDTEPFSTYVATIKEPDGREVSFFITFLRDADGTWYVDSL